MSELPTHKPYHDPETAPLAPKCHVISEMPHVGQMLSVLPPRDEGKFSEKFVKLADWWTS